jgi:hypothetical protein
MKLKERLNVLIQSATLSQKSGILTLDEAVKAKLAIDAISSGELNEKFANAINVLIQLAVESQKKGAYSLKDAHMIYLAIEGIESEFQNEVDRINGRIQQESPKTNVDNKSSENVIVIPPKQLKKQS